MPDISQIFRPTTVDFVRREHEVADVHSFFFRPRSTYRHRAGQHGLFLLPRLSGVHPFTLANSPDEEFVIIGTHVREGSRYKAHLESMTAGDSLTMRGPMLGFTLEGSEPTAVLLAQGIGITPFRSMLLDTRAHPRPLTTRLIHVDDEHPYRAVTESSADVSSYPSTRKAFAADLQRTVADVGGRATYYVSGSPAFITATVQELGALGVDKRAVKKDSFLGY